MSGTVMMTNTRIIVSNAERFFLFSVLLIRLHTGKKIYERIRLVMIVIINGFIIRKTNMVITINDMMKKYLVLSLALILFTLFVTKLIIFKVC